MNIAHDSSYLLGYVGVIVTVLLGLWGIYVTIKHRYFVSVSFILNKSIALFDTIVKNIPELSINYKDSPISQNLILIEGALINTGKKDILPAMIEKPICLILPEDYKWLEAKIISTSENVEATSMLDGSTLIINSGLLKINEHIIFHALLQTSHDDDIAKTEKNIQKIIKFSHRIADMHKIKNIKLEHIGIKQFIVLIGMLILGMIFLTSIGYDIYTEKPFMESIYEYRKDNKEVVNVIIEKFNDKNATIVGVDSPFIHTLPGKEFFKRSKKIGEKPTFMPFKNIALTLFLILDILLLIILVGCLLGYKRNNKYLRIFVLRQ